MKRWLAVLSLTLVLQANASPMTANIDSLQMPVHPLFPAHITPEITALLSKPNTTMWINVNGVSRERHILEPLTFSLSNSLLFRSILITPTRGIIDNKEVITEIKTGWEIIIKKMTDTKISIDINVMEKSRSDKTKVQRHTKTLHFTDFSTKKSCQSSSFTGEKIKSIQLCLKSMLSTDR
jgi:hypothetical protein